MTGSHEVRGSIPLFSTKNSGRRRESPLYFFGPVAQRLAQGTHNPWVGGSNPSGPTIVSPCELAKSVGSLFCVKAACE